MSRFPYQFFSQYVFRSPLFSLKDFLKKVGDDELSEGNFKEIYTDPIFQEAIDLASPYLDGEIRKWMHSNEIQSKKKLEKLKNTIRKYYNRMSHRCLAFKHEFNADKMLTSQLNKKYLLFVPKYYEFIESEDFSIHRENTINSITDSAEVIKNIQNRYAGTMKSLFQSIFHMNINRIFVSNQRLFEMIIYDYLFRYYKTLAFKRVSFF